MYGQLHVMSGDNLVHSVYLQMLSSWTVSLAIDNILYNVAHPLHLLSSEGFFTFYSFSRTVFSLILCIDSNLFITFGGDVKSVFPSLAFDQ